MLASRHSDDLQQIETCLYNDQRKHNKPYVFGMTHYPTDQNSHTQATLPSVYVFW